LTKIKIGAIFYPERANLSGLPERVLPEGSYLRERAERGGVKIFSKYEKEKFLTFLNVKRKKGGY